MHLVGVDWNGNEIISSIIQKLGEVKDEEEVAIDAGFSPDFFGGGVLFMEPRIHIC